MDIEKFTDKAKSLLQQAGLGSGFEIELQSINPPRFITQAAEVVAEHREERRAARHVDRVSRAVDAEGDLHRSGC